MVAHFWVEHGGMRQPILLRGVSYHRTPTERQVTESIRIENGMKSPESLLNLKSEWTGSKLSGVSVKVPMGVGKYREREVVIEEGVEESEERDRKDRATNRWLEAVRKGMKRMSYVREGK